MKGHPLHFKYKDQEKREPKAFRTGEKSELCSMNYSLKE